MSIICDIRYDPSSNRMIETKGLYTPKFIANNTYPLSDVEATTVDEIPCVYVPGKSNFIIFTMNAERTYYDTFSVIMKVNVVDHGLLFTFRNVNDHPDHLVGDLSSNGYFSVVNTNAFPNYTIPNTVNLLNTWHEWIYIYDHGLVNIYLDKELVGTYNFGNVPSQSIMSDYTLLFQWPYPPNYGGNGCNGYLNKFMVTDNIINLRNSIYNNLELGD